MDLKKIHWYGHDAFRIEDNGRQIYIDPWQLSSGLPRADVILVTHDHHDHYSEADVRKLSKAETRVVCPPDVAAKAGPAATPISPGEKVTIGDLQIAAVAAYNVSKPFHPRERGWVGYVVTLSDGTTVYHAGDTDATPEMERLKVDVALLPVSGTYVMTAEEAAAAANAMRPGLVIPMHFGTIVGTAKDAERFSRLFKGRTVIKTVEH